MGIHADIMRACQPGNADEALSAITRQHGRGATKFIANVLGKSTRQALRYLRGEVKNTAPEVEQAIEGAADEGFAAADALTNATFIDCGVVEVIYNGQPNGVRNIGRLAVTGEMRDSMEQAGALYADGDSDGGDQLMSEAIIGGYCQSKGGGFGDLSGTLDVSEFRQGFRLS